MAQYIKKSDLVAEIEKWISGWTERLNNTNPSNPSFFEGGIEVSKHILTFIDTLEVKGVDLEKELESWRHNHFHGRRDKEASGEYLERVSQLGLAKHFFELGLSSQLSWKDIELIAEIGMDFMNSEDSDNLNDEEYYTEILNRFKAQKGE